MRIDERQIEQITGAIDRVGDRLVQKLDNLMDALKGKAEGEPVIGKASGVSVQDTVSIKHHETKEPFERIDPPKAKRGRVNG